MEKFTQKWIIVVPLVPLDEGTEYSYTDWPLHITLASVFAVDYDGQTLCAKVEQLLADQRPLTAVADQEDWFGPDRSVRVMRMQKTPELLALYDRIRDMLVSDGVVYNAPQYEGDGYNPHSTYQKGARLAAGEQVAVESVAVIDMFPNADGYMR